ncbi:MAG: protein-tyrosine-phosphatase [Micrococcus sp.]|nr:protein-tyrosine-phosphatase [Micrococcus sp.]
MHAADSYPHATPLTAEMRERDHHVLDREAEHLQGQYPEVADVATVRRILQEAYEDLARTTANPSMLAAVSVHEATGRLRAVGLRQGSIESRHPRVLFVCHGNAGRSQMAAALLENRSQGTIRARSAGTNPAGHVLSSAVDAMAEIGVPLHHAVPKPLDEDIVAASEIIVVFSGAQEPDWPAGPEIRHWPVPTLRGLSSQQAAAVRDDVDLRVRELIHELSPSSEG